MKINQISSKLIKPHTPTPQNLKNYKLSFIDKVLLPLNIVVVLFYESKPEDEKELEESLAKILVDFYPLAGRLIKKDGLVDCSDQGAEFLKAVAVDVKLLDLITQTEIEHEHEQLVPYFNTDEAVVDPLLSIQITHFPCGGLAMGISISHRVFDASSVGTFIAAWSSAHRDKMVGGPKISPSFHLPALLPCRTKEIGDSSDWDHLASSKDVRRKVVKRRVLFDKVALASLKSKVRARSDGRSVSGVRVVSAVIAKALIVVDRTKHGGGTRDFIISQLINMRGRTVFHPQPKESCGNLITGMLTRRVAACEAEHIGIQELVDVVGDAIRKTISDHAQLLSPDTDGPAMIANTLEHILKQLGNPETNYMVFNDWSRFGFYEADFGWGKPVFTTISPQSHNNTVLMSDRDGDGIEAWVHLYQDHMPYFDQEIKRITSY